MTLDGIKEAIAQLPEYERQTLAAWLNELNYDDWDREMVADFTPGGRGRAVIEKVKRNIEEGKALAFEEGFKQANSKQNRFGR